MTSNAALNAASIRVIIAAGIAAELAGLDMKLTDTRTSASV